MLRKVIRLFALAICASSIFCAGTGVFAAMKKEVISSTKTLPGAGEFNVIAEPFDWGKDVTRIMINTGNTVSAAELNAGDFSVNAKHYSEQAYKDDYNGPRKITDVYPVDAAGNKADSGDYIILELEYGSGVQSAHTGSYSYANFYTPLTLTYTVKWNSETFKQHEVVSLLCDEFVLDRYTDPAISDSNYNFCDYAFYSPKDRQGKKPLIIFFHGMGEGGAGSLKNHGVQMYAYPEANFAGKEIQDIMGGAYVLLPQSPNQWPTAGFTNESGYLEVVNNLIDVIIAENPDIDTNRIYVGGLSMGGYMASRVILSRPEKYAAAFLCAQAYAMTEQDAEKLKDLPVWVSCSEADGTCRMDPYTYASYVKLVQAGNKDAKCAVMESNEQDATSRFRFYDNSENDFTLYYPSQEHENNIKGQFVWDNVAYSGHNGGWVPVFANGQFYENADGSRTSIMEWVASKNLYTGIEIDTSKVKKTFTVGEAFSADGLVVNVVGRDGGKSAVTGYSISGADTSKPGTMKVTVTYAGMTASYDITVQTPAVTLTDNLPSIVTSPVSVKLSESSVTLFKKGFNKTSIKAEVSGNSTPVVWFSSNKKVAVVSGNGVVTAKGAGKAVITAKAGDASASCTVTVKNATFKIKKASLTVKKGKTVKIKVTVSPKKSVKFKSASKLVKVDKKGVVKGLKKGNASVTVTYMGVKQTVKIKVK